MMRQVFDHNLKALDLLHRDLWTFLQVLHHPLYELTGWLGAGGRREE